MVKNLNRKQKKMIKNLNKKFFKKENQELKFNMKSKKEDKLIQFPKNSQKWMMPVFSY